MRLGVPELFVILAILLLMVGARRLPEIGRSLGEAIRAFQRGLRGRDDDDQTKEPS